MLYYKTVYQYGKNVLYFFYNIAQRTLTEEWREIFRVDIELYQHGSYPISVQNLQMLYYKIYKKIYWFDNVFGIKMKYHRLRCFLVFFLNIENTRCPFSEFVSLLRLPVGRGRVLNSPRFCFFFLRCRKSGHRSWVIPLAFLCCLAHYYTSFKPIL